MPVNKHLYKRYKIIDYCLRDVNREYTYETLLETVNARLRDIDCETIQLRQLKADLAEFNSKEDFVNIKLGRRKILRYENVHCPFPFDYFNDWIMTTINDILKLLSEPEFSGKPIFKSMRMLISHIPVFMSSKIDANFLEFEDNPFLKGIGHFDQILYSILNKVVVNIEYEPYGKSSIQFIAHPYSIKQYNNRWFLICSTEAFPNDLTNLAIDRIKSLQTNENIKFRDSPINIDEYFEDIIGVTVNKNEIEKIKLKISEKRYPYIESKPLHSSQTELKSERMDGYRIITIQVKPNQELMTLLFSYADDIEVLEPQYLREELRKKIENMYMKYTRK